MRDLTKGPITGHIIAMATPIAIGQLVSTLYFLIDLYFVSHLGEAALAGVSAAGTLVFLSIAITQVLTVGVLGVLARRVGAGDRDGANHVYNQSISLALAIMLATLIVGYLGVDAYMGSISADTATQIAGSTYLHWYMPGLALQFPITAIAASLRGTGVVKPVMLGQVLSIVVNIVLAPVLIAGWGTGHPLGVMGAGLASSCAVFAGLAIFCRHMLKQERYLKTTPGDWRPKFATWRLMLGIGLPSGAEFGIMFVMTTLIYFIIRDFGPAAQAGYGAGSRIMQALFLPVMSIAFSVPAIAGQNMGARQPERVRETFLRASLLCSALMLLAMLACQYGAAVLLRMLTNDAAIVAFGADFLRIIAWNFIGAGLIFCCSGMFQAFGNTLPSLYSMATRLITFAVPALIIARQPHFSLRDIWLLSVASVGAQAILSLILVRRAMRKHLGPLEIDSAAPRPT